MAEELFRTTFMGGFDKTDVLTRMEQMRAEAWEEQERLRQEIAAKDEKIAQLMKRLDLKDDQYARLEAEIEEKYQKYADNFEVIGKLVFDAQIKADEIIAKAREDAEVIRQKAEEEAEERLMTARARVDEVLCEGKRHYMEVQDEMNGIVELINQAQGCFMESYREIHRIVSSMPEALKSLSEEETEELEEIGADQELVNHMESILGEEE